MNSEYWIVRAGGGHLGKGAAPGPAGVPRSVEEFVFVHSCTEQVQILAVEAFPFLCEIKQRDL